MQPKNTNPNSGVPQQPGQPPFQRRPVQPIAPRPFASPQQQPAAPTPQPPRPQPTPQQFGPQPAQQPTPQVPRPAVDPFAPRPAAQPSHLPQQPQQFQPRPQQHAASTATPTFNIQRPNSPAPRPAQPDLRADTENSEFKMSLDFQQTKEKAKLPKGVLALILFGIVGLVVGVIDKSQHSIIFNAILALDILAAIALLIRKEFLHKAAFGLAIATVTVSAALALSYRGLAASTVKAESMFIEEAKKLQNQSPTKQLTHEQQQHLDAMQLQLEAQQQAVGENSVLVYGKYGGTIAAYALVILYLTRPKVKEAFVRAKE